MDDVVAEANLGGLLWTQTWSCQPLIWVISNHTNMWSQNGDVAMVSGDNVGRNVDSYTQREHITFGQETGGDGLHAISQSQTATSANTNAMELSLSPPATTNNGTLPQAPSIPAAALVVNKVSRKSAARGKQHLLATKDFYLKPEFSSNFDGDDGPVLQGYVSECPNKNSNQGRYRIDWQRNSALPPAVTADMLLEWFPSSKAFRDKLDAAIQKWMDEATDEQKKRVSRKRKAGSSTGTGTQQNPAVPQTPPTRRVHLEARAAMRTEASTATSSLSSRSAMPHGHSLLDRRPPRAPSPTNDPDAAHSDDDCSFTTASTRSTLGLDSDSEDGSQLDEEDNLYEAEDDSEEDEEDECRPHVEAPDLSERARGYVGEYLKALQWSFEPVSTEIKEPYRPYSGPHGLRAGVSEKFNDPFECFSECGGFTSLFVARLAANSNDYYYHHIKPDLGRNRYCNEEWKDITTEEMYHFLGIMLKISLSTVDGGGYAAYFAEEDKVIYADSGRRPITMSVANSKGWAQNTMKLNRFKQVRGAFHPEDKTAGIGKDKCYQLRHVLNQLNAAALSSFHMGPNVAFDEGGVACRSRFCPVRQHNKDKPDKYRVDFFMLCDSKHYFIYHMDVYQGKNKHNACIHPHAADLPTTQKAVMNSVFKTDLSTPDPLGCRHLASDNRCNCPELLCVLRDKCRTCGTGTCRKKRKGWDPAIHTMMKDKSNRGQSVLSCDSSNRIICGEWMDSKVVNFATSLMDSTSTTVANRFTKEGLSVSHCSNPLPTDHGWRR